MRDHTGTWKRLLSEGSESVTVLLVLRNDGSYNKRIHASSHGRLGGAHEGTWITQGDRVQLSGDRNWPACSEDMTYFEKVDGDAVDFPPPPSFQDESFASEMERVAAMMHLDRRYLAAVEAIHASAPHDALLQELYSVQFGYEELLPTEPSKYGLPAAKAIRRKVADTQDSIARVFEAKHDLQNATIHFEAAAKKYEQLGDFEKAVHARASIWRLNEMAEEEIDAELRRAEMLLKDTSPQSLERAAALVEMGEFQVKSGHKSSAGETLRLALTELRELNLDTPEAALAETAHALRTGRAASGKTPIERMVAVRELLARANLALAQLSQRDGRTEDQSAYLAEAEIYSVPLSHESAEKILQRFLAGFSEDKD
ncbi:hypothetical protein [Silvibacterium acidisoli]|uniref:hypothetical protein n=1 Tax=Acidobacteriaceae bacterium ZG23-2 TaxID=2883246 RepID=UPI00406C414D